MQEKEQKLFLMLESQTQRGLQKAGLTGVIPPKYSGGMSTSNGTGSAGAAGPWSNNSSKSTTPTPSSIVNPVQPNPGKVNSTSRT